MKPRLANMALCAALSAIAASAYADVHRAKVHDGHQVKASLRVVSNGSTVGQAGYGWRYFSDLHEGRAVVISPGGDYYYSTGEGLTVVRRGSA